MICQQIRAFIGRSRASEAGTWHRLPRKICGDLSLPLSFKDGARNAAFPAIRVFEIVPPQPRGGIGVSLCIVADVVLEPRAAVVRHRILGDGSASAIQSDLRVRTGPRRDYPLQNGQGGRR